MNYFAQLDERRRITAVFPSDEAWSASRPDGCVEISHAVWLQWMGDKEAILSDDALSLVPSSQDIGLVKSILQARIDAEAERSRLRFITPGYGQSMTYAQKADEAKRYMADLTPADEDYPMLSSEVGITASTLLGVAHAVSAANARWLEIGAAIEAARLSAKKAINEAETIEDAQAAADAVVWP